MGHNRISDNMLSCINIQLNIVNFSTHTHTVMHPCTHTLVVSIVLKGLSSLQVEVEGGREREREEERERE